MLLWAAEVVLCLCGSDETAEDITEICDFVRWSSS